MRIPSFASLTRRAGLVLVLVLLGPVAVASAQGYIDQVAVADLLNRRAETLDDIPEVFYEYFVLSSSSGNSVIARNTFYKIIGNSDILKGRERAELVQMINRRLMQNTNIGDTLIIPTRYDLDFRAFSPFPRYYIGGREFDKLFIMDKTIQAFAAYEYGQLVRWGIINTGNPDESPTPNGRYNFNWKEEYRVSSLSPPGEDWEMYWVVNFHQARGMHIHQYEMPTGGPTSHGCVRLVDADAEWTYHWVDTWTTTSKSDGIASARVRLIEPGTTVLVLGVEPADKPQPFDLKKRYPVLKRVGLPVHPYDIPPGTQQQERWDKIRAADTDE